MFLHFYTRVLSYSNAYFVLWSPGELLNPTSCTNTQAQARTRLYRRPKKHVTFPPLRSHVGSPQVNNNNSNNFRVQFEQTLTRPVRSFRVCSHFNRLSRTRTHARTHDKLVVLRVRDVHLSGLENREISTRERSRVFSVNCPTL